MKVRVKVLATIEFMEDYFGSRCEEFDPECVVCSNYKRFDDGRKVHLEVDRHQFFKLLVEGEL